jgi:small subunit ribosomal protein S17
MAEQSTTRELRLTKIGTVTSHKRDKTIKVEVPFTIKHTKYGKHLRRQAVFHAHDEKNEAHVGDQVEIMMCRPISKTKSWRLVRIVTAAPREAVTS